MGEVLAVAVAGEPLNIVGFAMPCIRRDRHLAREVAGRVYELHQMGESGAFAGLEG